MVIVGISAGGNEVEGFAYVAYLDETETVAECYAAFFVEGRGCAA